MFLTPNSRIMKIENALFSLSHAKTPWGVAPGAHYTCVVAPAKLITRGETF